jgi:hypothetical protein
LQQNIEGVEILKHNSLLAKLFALIILIVLPWVLNSGSSESEVLKLNENSLRTYDSLICDYSILEFASENTMSNYDIRLDTTSSIGCFSKINGTGKIDNDIVIYVGTNLNIDLLIQSSFWLVLISMIPTSRKLTIKYKHLSIVCFLILVLFHLNAEESFYNLNSKIFSTNFSQNYLLYSYLISLYLVLLVFLTIFENRFYNLINYLPFIFVTVGTYNTSNLNFFLLCLSLIGITQVFVNKWYRLGLVVTLFLITFWTSQISTNQLFFDVDKLKGFTSSAYNLNSIFYWSLSYFFFCCGLAFLFTETIKFIQINKLLNNFLYSGVLITTLSIISATGPIQNLFTYYYLGLNKGASSTFDSVSGNAWRGISSSAEAVGEFFAFTVLLVITVALTSKSFRIGFFQQSLILVNLYGLYRSNNFAATFSMLLLIIFICIFYYIRSIKVRTLLVSLILVSIPVSYFLFFNTASLDELNRKVIKEGLEISYIEGLETNEYGQSAIEQNRFLELLQSQEGLSQVSTSLTFLINEYHFSERNNLPNITSLISSVAYPINRSEKWGVFIGKYNPNINTFLLGTGLNNLSNYYLNHPTKTNTGLVLPHSGILSYLIYTGCIGLFLFFSFIIRKVIISKDNHLYLVSIVFFILNVLKSDSVLYINSFILFVFIIHLDKLVLNKSHNETLVKEL